MFRQSPPGVVEVQAVAAASLPLRVAVPAGPHVALEWWAGVTAGPAVPASSQHPLNGGAELRAVAPQHMGS